VSTLRWDATRGGFSADSGAGPFVGHWGWVRTGWGTSAASTVGEGNCGVSQPWDSNSSGDYGTVIQLPDAGAVSWDAPPTRISPWIAGTISCDVSFSVWCVEDSPGAGG
jgi:hypothetical protein